MLEFKVSLIFQFHLSLLQHDLTFLPSSLLSIENIFPFFVQKLLRSRIKLLTRNIIYIFFSCVTGMNEYLTCSSEIVNFALFQTWVSFKIWFGLIYVYPIMELAIYRRTVSYLNNQHEGMYLFSMLTRFWILFPIWWNYLMI